MSLVNLLTNLAPVVTMGDKNPAEDIVIRRSPTTPTPPPSWPTTFRPIHGFAAPAPAPVRHSLLTREGEVRSAGRRPIEAAPTTVLATPPAGPAASPVATVPTTAPRGALRPLVALGANTVSIQFGDQVSKTPLDAVSRGHVEQVVEFARQIVRTQCGGVVPAHHVMTFDVSSADSHLDLLRGATKLEINSSKAPNSTTPRLISILVTRPGSTDLEILANSATLKQLGW